MKILFAASEMVPFCKTGGLADVVGSLPPVLAALGNEVHVILPGYRSISREKYGFRENCARFQVTVGPVTKPVSISSASWKGVSVHLVENKEYFDRPFLYGDENGDYFDNGPRFICYCRGVLETLKCIGFQPHIVHAHDWQAGLIPAYIGTVFNDDPFFRHAKTLFTIHNLGYQGVFQPWVFSLSGVPDEEFRWQRMEYYGNVSFLKSGIVYADAVSTVSATYAKEITKKPLGFGLEGVLAERRNILHGILNGIDTEEWDPATDMTIPERYSVRGLNGKARCRKVLLEQVGLSAGGKTPVFGIVSRLVEQKGFDILEEAMEKLALLDLRLVILGTGTREHNEAMRRFADKYPDRIRLLLKFDVADSRLIYAGSDAFLIPSRYEPCGLGQMIAMRYGTLPVAHSTGGLADTVFDLDKDPVRGNGFTFSAYSAAALVAVMKRTVTAFGEQGRPRWQAAMVRGMNEDFSWKRSAERYIGLFQKMLGGRK